MCSCSVHSGIDPARDHVIHYSNCGLDRASILRAEPDRLALTGADTGVIPIWRDRCMVDEAGRPLILAGCDAAAALPGELPRVFLGLENGHPVLAVDLSLLPEHTALEQVGGAGTIDVRRLVGAAMPATTARLAYARGLLYWHRTQAFCGQCGAPTESRQGGHARACTGQQCAKLHFPRIEPAIIVLVEAPGEDRCLLARHAGSASGSYSTLAGFVEVGENLEDAVRREVMEEAGIPVADIRYRGSQAWPFPAGMMIAFRAGALSVDAIADGMEILDLRWFTLEEMLDRLALHRQGNRQFNDDSIEKFLIEQWVADRQGSRAP